MKLVAFDYAMIGILAVGLPLYGLWEYRSMRRWASDPRVRSYKLTILTETALSLLVLGLWATSARDFTDLGLGLEPAWRWWLGVAIAVVTCVLLTVQTVTLWDDTAKLANVRRQFGGLRDLLPRNAREERWWIAMSITVGICEELLYRGYLIVVLDVFLELWQSVLLSTLVFGSIHLYQGRSGILKTGAFGLVLVGLFLLTGSLWVPMLIHMAMDIASGITGRRALQQPTHAAPAHREDQAGWPS